MINFASVQKTSPTYLDRLFPKRVLGITILISIVFYLSGCATSQHNVNRKSDLALFHDDMLMMDNSFSPEAHAVALEKFKVLESAAEKMSDAEFGLALTEIAAIANNGHSGAYFPWGRNYSRLAVRFYIADDGLFIADAIPEFEHLVGERIQTIENQTLDQLRTIFDRYITGTLGQRDQRMYRFLEFPEALYAAKIATSNQSVSLVLENGQRVDVGITEEWPALEGFYPRFEYALAARGRIKGNPLYLQEPEKLVRLIDLPKYDAVYLQYLTNRDDSGKIDIYEISRKIQEDLAKKQPSHIIVDQRFNGGGDLSNTRELMQAIPTTIAEEGKIIVITSGRTFSAAISSVGYLKQAGGSRVTIIGAPIGDELEFWAEGPVFELPHSGTIVQYSTEKHNYRDGCLSDDCHSYMKTHPIAVPTLDPDIQPALNFEMVMNGEDPYLDAAIELIK